MLASWSSLLNWTLSFLFLLLLGVETIVESRGHGDGCSTNPDCLSVDPHLRCANVASRSTGVVKKLCQCSENYLWKETTASCQAQNEVERAEEIAKIITYLIPGVLALAVLICVLVFCCYWVNQTSKREKSSNVSESEAKYEPEIRRQSVSKSRRRSETPSRATENIAMSTSVEVVQETGAAPFASAGRLKVAVPQLKINGIKESTLGTAITSPTRSTSDSVGSEGKHVVKQVTAAPPSPVIDVTSTPVKTREPGYQASMRQLLTSPQMHSEPGTRPVSAAFISNTRPSTAIGVGLRPSSALLMPKEGLNGGRPISAGRISPGIVGPYLTDASKMRLRESLQAVAAAKAKKEAEAEAGKNPGELVDLYDKVVETAKAEEEAKKTVPSGIEEIRLVRVAANAFKKKRNLRNLHNGGNRSTANVQKGKGGTKLESLVEQIMRLRLEEDKKPKPIFRKGAKTHINHHQQHPLHHQQAFNGKHRRDSTQSAGGSSNSADSSRSPSSASSRPLFTLDGRPESVAQRVLRERQEKKIKAKVPVTSNPRPPPSALRRMRQQRQKHHHNKTTTTATATAQSAKAAKLHVALRQSASQHSSRANLTEKIKQQVHLNAVKNYHAPSIEAMMEQPPATARPVKSILKKNVIVANGGAGAKPKKVGRVNYAFDKDVADSDGENDSSKTNVHSFRAEVYTPKEK